MTEELLEISRRRLLAGLGGIGLASTGAGLGTSAFFSDREEFDGNELVAGKLDLMVNWQEHYADWSEDEQQAAPDARMVDDPGDLNSGEIALPISDAPLLAVPGGQQFADFWNVTSIDAYPDPDDDGVKEFQTRQQVAADPANTGLSPEEIDQVYRDQFANVPDFFQDNGRRPLIDIADVKPGDFGEVTFGIHLFSNPGFIWMNGRVQDASENGKTEPELDDPDEKSGPDPTGLSDDYVELLDEIQVAIWHDDGDNVLEETEMSVFEKPPGGPDAGENVDLTGEDRMIARGSLRSVLDQLSSGRGIPLDADPTTPERDCFPNSTDRYFGFAWWLPVDHANEIQTDSVEFDLGFYTEQCRHNDGSGMPPERLLTLTGSSPQGQGEGFANAWDTSSSLARRGSGSWGTVDHSPSGTGDATDTDSDSTLEYKQGFYFGGEFSNFGVLPGFTVSEIEEIAYWLYEPTPLEGVDIYLNIYTRPEGDGDDAASWYDSRLQALPSEANQGSPNFTAGEWNEFTTTTGASNTLTWSDTGRGGNFNQPLPPLGDLQSGTLDWSSYGANLSTTHDYSDEEILALSLQTGSESGVGLEAYIDDVTVRLTNGAELVLDLEP